MHWKGRNLRRGGKTIGQVRQLDNGLWEAILRGVSVGTNSDEASARYEVEQHLKFQDRRRS